MRENEKEINKLERDLFQLSRLKKEGKNVNGLIKNTEVVLFQEVDKGLQEHHHLKKWDKELNETEKKVEEISDKRLGIDETPEEIIFREAPLGEQTDVEKPRPESKKKTRKNVNMSATWNSETKRKELKKQIRGEIDELQEKQFKLNKEKVNPYWEYVFTKPKQILIGLGDFHYGSKTCDVKKIKQKVEIARKTHSAVICMGDLLENANRYSVGAGIYEQVMTPMEQMDDVCKLLKPIKEQIMVMIDGNHEFRTWKESGFKPTQIMAERLGVPYAGFEAFVRMKVKKFLYTIFATHGSTGARFAWTRMKALEDVMRHVDADIVLYAHTHDKLYHEVRYKGIAEKKKIGVLTGSFLKDDPYGYAAMKNLPPVKTGLVVLELSGSHWDVHGED